MDSRNLHGKRLIGESLEPRELLAGDVSASVFRGTLYISGDNAANFVLVSGTGTAGEFQVTGLSDLGSSPTSINHVANGTQTFDGVTNIVANLKGGDDFFGFTNGTLRGNLSIDMGTGDDQTGVGLFPIPGALTTVVARPSVTPLQVPIGPVSATICGSLWINLGAGDNSLLETSTLVKGSESINGCDGDDDVNLTDAAIFDVGVSTLGTGVTILRDLNVNLGGGSNEFEAYDLDVDGSLCDTGCGSNFVELAIVNIGHNANFEFCGPGGQVFILGPVPTLGSTLGTQNHVGGNLNVSTGWGSDTIEEASLAVGGSNWISTDGGDDEVLLGTQHDNIAPSVVPIPVSDLGVTVGKILNVDLGSGSDILDAIDVVVCGSFSVYQGGGTLSADLENVLVANLLKISTRSGDDDVTLTSVQAKNLIVALGRGNDTVTVTDATVAQTASFDGGQGYDTFNDGGGNSYGKFKRTNFEVVNV